MSDNPYTDDEYDDTYKEVHGDEGARPTDDRTDDTFFPSGRGGSMSPSGWGIWPTGDTADATAENEYDETADYDRTGTAAETGTDDSDGSWWDVGLIGTLLVAGVALFLFPEPATSAIGIGLIALGVVAWVVDWIA